MGDALMSLNPLERLPDEWKTSVVRVVAGGRDRDGRWQAGERSEVDDCLLVPATTGEHTDYSSVVTAEAILYAPASSEWASSDTVETPRGSVLPGTWNIDGDPVRWPFGWQINLVRGA